MFPSSIVAFLRALLGLATAACGIAGPAAPLEAELPALREAAQRGNLKALEAGNARFSGHLLEAYPHYWWLQAQIVRAETSAVREFLERHADSPLAEQLRREWVKVLGAAGRWELFRQEHVRLPVLDPEIACFAFQERLARDDPEVMAEVGALFRSAREVPLACDAPFAAAVASGVVSESEIAERARRLLQANAVVQAKRANALLPPRQRIAERSIDQAAADPARYLARRAKDSLATRNEREVALFAIARLARSRPAEAAERLAALEPKLGSAAAASWAHVAHHAALVHHPQALEWFAKAGDAPLTGEQAAWKARAALRAGDWKQVYAAVSQMSPDERREPAWRYWRAQALRELGETEPAATLLQSVAMERGFYGLLAAEELGTLSPPDWDGGRPQAADIERVGQLPGVRRALALYRVGLDPEALREWTWALRGADDRTLIAAAEIVRRAGEPDRAINTANRTVQLHDFSQRYPIAHHEAVGSAARQWGQDEALMFSIIRQESRFMPEARSRVGAAGLMQLMPATASWVARQMPLRDFRQEMLQRPEVNVQMGTYYFQRILASLGHPLLAIAGYNAGPGRARRWLDERPLEGAIYAETIPFNETRDYVKQVFANAWHYRNRLTGQVPSLREMLGRVPGRGGDTASAVVANN